jgi:hypothetical protein
MVLLEIEERLGEIKNWFYQYNGALAWELKERSIPKKSIQFAPLYRRPRKIWGIDLNHAVDLKNEDASQHRAKI